MRSFTFLIFVFLTFCCWGIYGPVLHQGQEALGDGPKKLSSLRPFICVGIAYFLIAVVYPAFVLKTKGENGTWSAGGFIWSFVAGAVGAIGALGIILAFKFGGKPVYVMPLVFGLAPIVNTFVTMSMAGTFKQAKPIFFVGILLAALGAAGVLRFKPSKAKPVEAPKASQVETGAALTAVSLTQEGESEGAASGEASDGASGEATSEEAISAKPDSAKADSAKLETTAKSETNLWLVGACIGLTALCWGAYGPVLHSGQAKMAGSRLRPFLCVGLAYFAIAVIVPLILIPNFPPEPGSWESAAGIGWSLLAGAAGAIGALGIIYAFNFGGKPIFIMPLVFGIAPVVNTLTETLSKNLLGQVSPLFLASLATVIIGATIVLVFAPRGPKPKPAAAAQ
jgi:hypothetical protein